MGVFVSREKETIYLVKCVRDEKLRFDKYRQRAYIENFLGFVFGENEVDKSPDFRIFFKLEAFSLFDRREFRDYFFFALLVFVLSIICAHLILRPLRRIEKEVESLNTDGSEDINVDNYPRELKSLAEALMCFILATRNARQDAKEAEEKAIKAERDNREAQRKTDANREKILRQTIDLSDKVEHHVGNIIPEDMLEKNLATSSLEALKVDFRKLVNRAYDILDRIDIFVEKVSTIGQEDIIENGETAKIQEILKLEIEFLKNFEAKNKYYEITGLEKIQDIQVSMSPDMLETICVELLRNSTKYSDSKILIQLGMDDNKLWAKFHNDGEKFPEEKRETMFDYGVRAKTKRNKGTGRGLFFVKQAADITGCVVELKDSDVLSGACVYLEVPLSQNAPNQPPGSH